MYSDAFILTTTLIYKHRLRVEYEYNVDIKLIPFAICSIYKPTHFILVLLHLQKKKKTHKQTGRQSSKQSKHTTFW